MTGRLASAQGGGDTWQEALEACIEGLGPLPAGSNLGFVYVNEVFGDHLPEIAAHLRRATGLEDWLGAVGFGVVGPGGEVPAEAGGSLAVLAGCFAPESFAPFAGREAHDPGAFRSRHGAWLARQRAVTALVHGDPAAPHLAEMIEGVAEASAAFLIGGLVAGVGGQGQLARAGVPDSGLSGVLLGDGVELITGLTQGCVPIGPSHRVTESEEEVLVALDGRPPLDILKEEAGDLIARDLRRAAGIIHIALPRELSDGNDYMVRNLTAIDPGEGMIAVAARLAVGDRMMFVRRDANAAQKDMQRMVDDLRRRLDGRPVAGGLYVSCVARGAAMFGRAGRELEMIRDTLGEFPLIGFSANGEICGDRLYAYTGVLALFVGR